VLEPADLGLPEVQYAEIKGGATVAESAEIFMKILSGAGSDSQNAVVIANAGMALYCGDRNSGIEVGMARAKEALESKKALETFKKLIDVGQ
jgi:anthranilate phosphoribosyltransferase